MSNIQNLRLPDEDEEEKLDPWLTRQWQRFQQWIEVPQLEGSGKSRKFYLDDMDAYKKEQRERRRRWPIRWLLSETLPDAWNKTVQRCWTDPKDWVRFRTWDRYNHVHIRSLTPNYYDKDTIMLHVMFQLLVDFVEVELASMNFPYWEDRGIKRPRMRDHVRCVEAGLNYLEWESNHTPSLQQQAARTKLELYTWWTVTRAQREDPWAWQHIWPHDDDGKRLPYNPESGELASYLEQHYDQEDQEMLKRLVDIRFSLWS